MRTRLSDFALTSLTGSSAHAVGMSCRMGCLLVTHGVSHGSVLGPLLFIIYINDLPSVLDVGHASLYADDTVIYCYGSSSQELTDKLNQDLVAVAKWLNEHKLTLNLDKTKCMLIAELRRPFRAAKRSPIHIMQGKDKGDP